LGSEEGWREERHADVDDLEIGFYEVVGEAKEGKRKKEVVSFRGSRLRKGRDETRTHSSLKLSSLKLLCALVGTPLKAEFFVPSRFTASLSE